MEDEIEWNGRNWYGISIAALQEHKPLCYKHKAVFVSGKIAKLVLMTSLCQSYKGTPESD